MWGTSFLRLEEQAANLDWAAAASSEVPMFAQMQPVLKEQAQRALFDEQAAKEVLPRLDVVCIFSLRTHFAVAWGMIQLKKQNKEEAQQGRYVRSIRFTGIILFIGMIPKSYGQLLLMQSIVKPFADLPSLI